MPWLPVPDGKIFYQIEGSGPPVVLIHGLGSSLRDWEKQVPSFHRYFRVISLDLRGHGRSVDCPGPYTIPRFADDAATLIQFLEVGPVGVVGISLGGMVAFQLALDHPELVCRLVVVNALASVHPSSWRVRWVIRQRIFMARVMGMRWNGRVLGRKMFPAPGQAELREKFARRWAENNPRAYTATLRGIYGWSVEELLSELRCPTLVVAGEKDFIPVAEKERYVGKIPAATMEVIVDSGHASPVDQPEVFNRMVIGYLKNAGC